MTYEESVCDFSSRKRYAHGGNIPKVLVMLKNKPLILYVLHEIDKIGQLIKPVVVVGYGSKKVEGVLGNEYLFAYQEEQLGTAHALLAAKRKVKAENIVVLYGDMPFIKSGSLKALIQMHFKTGANISMLTAQVESFKGIYHSLEHYGRIARDPIEHKIIRIIEYKDASDIQKKIKEINPGLYMFNTKWLWENLEKIKNQNAQKEYYLTDIIDIAITQGEQVRSLMVEAKEVIGINSGEDLAIAEKLIDHR